MDACARKRGGENSSSLPRYGSFCAPSHVRCPVLSSFVRRGATLLFQTYVQPILERTQRASGGRSVDTTPALEKASRFMSSLQAAKEKMMS